MQIIMTQTRSGSEDGFTVRQFQQGTEYDVQDSEARRFIRNGWATEMPAAGRYAESYRDNKRAWLDCHDYLREALPRHVAGEVTAAMTAMIDESEKRFRPLPTRGSAPQNPATLAGRGEEV